MASARGKGGETSRGGGGATRGVGRAGRAPTRGGGDARVGESRGSGARARRGGGARARALVAEAGEPETARRARSGLAAFEEERERKDRRASRRGGTSRRASRRGRRGGGCERDRPVEGTHASGALGTEDTARRARQPSSGTGSTPARNPARPANARLTSSSRIARTVCSTRAGGRCYARTSRRPLCRGRSTSRGCARSRGAAWRCWRFADRERARPWKGASRASSRSANPPWGTRWRCDSAASRPMDWTELAVPEAAPSWKARRRRARRTARA